jgi:membrane-associated phospholipid phosphatase
MESARKQRGNRIEMLAQAAEPTPSTLPGSPKDQALRGLWPTDAPTPLRRAVSLSRRALLLAGPLALVWYSALVSIGFLLSGQVARMLGDEDSLVRTLEENRTPGWDSLSEIASRTADTRIIVISATLIGLVLRWLFGRWLEPIVLWSGMALQGTMFLLTTLVVSRSRPGVDHLDPAPPTSSFPSGHTGASSALYLGVGLVLAGNVRRPVLRVVIFLAVLAIPLSVAASRLYRGMHHPSDVVFGLLNGLAAVLIARYAVGHALLRRQSVIPMAVRLGEQTRD